MVLNISIKRTAEDSASDLCGGTINAVSIQDLFCRMTLNNTVIYNNDDVDTDTFPTAAVTDPISTVAAFVHSFVNGYCQVVLPNWVLQNEHTFKIEMIQLGVVSYEKTFTISGYDLGKDANNHAEHPVFELVLVESPYIEGNSSVEAYASVVKYRIPFTNNLRICNSSSTGAANKKLIDVDAVETNGDQFLICDKGESNYEFSVQDNNALVTTPCILDIAVPEETQVPELSILSICANCSENCGAIVGENLKIRMVMDFDKVMKVRITNAGEGISLPAYLFTAIQVVYTIYSPFGEVLLVQDMEDIACTPGAWNDANTLFNYEPTEYGTVVVLAEIYFKLSGQTMMKCQTSKTIVICPNFNITRSECNTFNITNYALDGATWKVEQHLSSNNIAEVLVDTVNDINDTVIFTAPTDGVYRIKWTNGEVIKYYYFVADCNFQKCLLAKTITIGQGDCGCSDGCSGCDSMYDIGSLAISGAGYFLLTMHDNEIFSQALQNIDSVTLNKILDLACIISGLQNYCCTDPCKDC